MPASENPWDRAQSSSSSSDDEPDKISTPVKIVHSKKEKDPPSPPTIKSNFTKSDKKKKPRERNQFIDDEAEVDDEEEEEDEYSEDDDMRNFVVSDDEVDLGSEEEESQKHKKIKKKYQDSDPVQSKSSSRDVSSVKKPAIDTSHKEKEIVQKKRNPPLESSSSSSSSESEEDKPPVIIKPPKTEPQESTPKKPVVGSKLNGVNSQNLRRFNFGVDEMLFIYGSIDEECTFKESPSDLNTGSTLFVSFGNFCGCVPWAVRSNELTKLMDASGCIERYRISVHKKASTLVSLEDFIDILSAKFKLLSGASKKVSSETLSIFKYLTSNLTADDDPISFKQKFKAMPKVKDPRPKETNNEEAKSKHQKTSKAPKYPPHHEDEIPLSKPNGDSHKKKKHGHHKHEEEEERKMIKMRKCEGSVDDIKELCDFVSSSAKLFHGTKIDTTEFRAASMNLVKKNLNFI